MAYGTVASRGKNWSAARNVSVPGQIRCNRCSIVKPSTAFSQAQKNILVDHLSRNPNQNAADRAHIVCMGCTTKQVHELQCFYCNKWKGLDSFPKTARRTPDNARCWICAQEVASYEPGAESDDTSGSGGDGSDGSDYEDFTLDGGATLHSDFGSLSIRQPGTFQSTHGTVTSGSAGGVRLDATSNSGNSILKPSASTSTTGTISASILHSNGPPHLRVQGKAPASTLFNQTWNESKYGGQGRRGPSSEASSDQIDDGKFAKIRAVPRNVQYDKYPEEPVRGKQKQKQKQKQDSDDDSDQNVVAKDSDDDSDDDDDNPYVL